MRLINLIKTYPEKCVKGNEIEILKKYTTNIDELRGKNITAILTRNIESVEMHMTANGLECKSEDVDCLITVKNPMLSKDIEIYSIFVIDDDIFFVGKKESFIF